MKQRTIRKKTLLRIYASIVETGKTSVEDTVSRLRLSRDAATIGLYTLAKMGYAVKRRYRDSGVCFYPERKKRYLLLFLCGTEHICFLTDGCGNILDRLCFYGDPSLYPDENLHIFLKNVRVAAKEDGYAPALARACLCYPVKEDGTPVSEELSLLSLEEFCATRLGVRHLCLRSVPRAAHPSDPAERLASILAVLDERIQKKPPVTNP